MLENRTTRGRPRGTTKRDLELIAMRLFTEQGFDETTVEQIAAAAGISGRTFFRYFPTKAEVLWWQFDDEVAALRAAFATVPDDVPLMTAVRRVVVSANQYRAEDVPELRTRMQLVATVPALSATAGAHYDAWERAVSAIAARRKGEPPDARNGDRAGLSFVDIDRFKHDYDRFGHGTGDQILTAVAGRLQD
ncbi:TetR family transcriptional regulator, partial [Nocardia abscessus]|uniref:acyl-CoA-like ligand-binding transcription factor n=1 Tax=Nocardia abscessus TaxID=120957 RepID=UPI0024591016